MSTEALLIPYDGLERVVLDDVSWSRYEELLKEFEERPSFRLTFDQGRLEIMSPLPEHDAFDRLVGRLVEFMGFERNVSVFSLGSTTFRNAAKRKGLEPDNCYYIANAARIRGIRGRWNPKVHPAPDLVIEVDITSRSIPRQPIYAALGVPEIWRVTYDGIGCLHLSDGGRYRPSPRSLSFPFLSPSSLWPWVQRLEVEEDLLVLKDFREWVRKLR